MSVQPGPTEKRYAANGVSLIYTVPFLVIEAGDLQVLLNGTLITSGFTHVGVGLPISYVEFTLPPTGDLLLQLNVPFQRLNDYQENGDFLSSTVNRDFDRIWQALKQLLRTTSRSPVLGINDIDGAGFYRAKGNGLRDLADPVENHDAVHKLWLQQYLATVLGSVTGPVNNAANVFYKGPDNLDYVVQDLSNKINALKGAWLIGYRGRTVGASLSDRINVKDYGVVGDGVVDDTAAIQALINYAGTFDNAFGCSLYFPRGDYLYSSLTMAKSHVKLVGDGDARLIKSGATGAGLIIGGIATRVYGNSVTGIAFASKINGTAGAQIHAINAGQLHLDRVVVTEFPARPFNGVILENVVQVILESCSVSKCIGEGVSASDSVDIYISNTRSDDNGIYGFSFRTCSGVYAQFSAFGNGSSGVYTDNSVVAPVSADGNAYHFYTNCISDTSGQHNWLIKNLKHSQLTACWGSTQSTLSASWVGIVVNACDGLDLTGCVCLNNNSDGLLVLGASIDIKVNGGRYAHNGVITAGSNRYGIHIGSGCSVVLDSVRMTDYATGGAGDLKTQAIGLKCDSSVASLIVTSCDMTGNLTGPYAFDSAPTFMMESVNRTGESIEIASANTVTLPYFGSFFGITGTTSINGLSVQWSGRRVMLVFRGALTVGDTGALKIANAYTTSANATLSLVSDGTNWYETARSVNG